jgi:hypothetical protein
MRPLTASHPRPLLKKHHCHSERNGWRFSSGPRFSRTAPAAPRGICRCLM